MKKGWEYITLGSAFSTATGTTPPKSKSEYYGYSVPFVKPPELVDAPLASSADNLSEEGAAVARLLPPLSILVSCIGNLGKLGLSTVRVAFNQQINAILPDESKAIPQFMFYQALSPSFKEQLESLASGTTVPIVNKSKFNSIGIVLPPLPEQKRIVGILDEAFAGIATARANAEKNLENARALFESHLNQVFTQRGEGWVEKKLGKVCEVVNGGTPKTKVADYWGGPHQWITPAEMGRRASPYVERTERALSDTGLANCSARLLPPKSVILSSRAPIGHLVINVEPMAFNQGCKGLVPGQTLDAKFLYYYLNNIVDLLNALGTGATFKELSSGKLKEVSIPFPPLPEQKRIVARLDALRDETRHLETICRQKIDELEALKKSLLHKAFNGEL